jgi:hypothetical protein
MATEDDSRAIREEESKRQRNNPTYTTYNHGNSLASSSTAQGSIATTSTGQNIGDNCRSISPIRRMAHWHSRALGSTTQLGDNRRQLQSTVYGRGRNSMASMSIVGQSLLSTTSTAQPIAQPVVQHVAQA